MNQQIFGINQDLHLEPMKAQTYAKDPWDKSLKHGLYFSAMHELNQHIYVKVGIHKKDQTQDWFYALHALYDGFSLLNTLDQKYDLQLNLQNYQKKKRIVKKPVKALIKAITSNPIEDVEYIKKRTPTSKIAQDPHFQIIFNEEDTEKINQKSLTSFLLTKINKVVTPKIAKNKINRWMVPTNMRPFEEKKNHRDIMASYIGVNLKQDESHQEVKHQLMHKLKDQEHYGYWLLSKLGLSMGTKTLIKETKRTLESSKQTWFGLLSNLGDIGGKNTLIEQISIVSPVRWHRPVSFVSYIYQGKLNLIGSFHQSLNLTETELKEIEDAIQSRLLF